MSTNGKSHIWVPILISLVAVGVSLFGIVADQLGTALDAGSAVPIALSEWSHIEALDYEIAVASERLQVSVENEDLTAAVSVLEGMARTYEERARSATLAVSAAMEALYVFETTEDPVSGSGLVESTSIAAERDLPEIQKRVDDLDGVILSAGLEVVERSWGGATCARQLALSLQSESNASPAGWQKVLDSIDVFVNYNPAFCLRAGR